MCGKIIYARKGLTRNFLSSALRRLRDRRAGVALIFALSAPVLIAATGLSVDVGYWFQNQTSLQSAADAASLAAAMNDARLGQTSSTGKANAAAPYAQVAADNASNSQFNFAAQNSGTNPTLSVTCCTTVGTAVGNYTGTTTYTATVNAARPSFFAKVAGMGLHGLANGTQYASASASITIQTLVSGNSCLSVNPQNNAATGITFVNENGGGSSGGVSAANCAITVNCGTGDTAFNPPNSSNSTISAQNIMVANANGCNVGYSSNLFTNSYSSNHSSCGSSNNYCGVQTSSAVAGDPLGSMGNALGDSSTAAWQAACTAAGFTSSSSSAVNLLTALGASWPYGGTIYSVSGTCEPSNSTADFSGGGTYFFPYGLNIQKNSVTFGPGIYYFGGNLSGAGQNTVTSNGATLVFVGSATLSMSGTGNKVALVAPDPSLGDSCLPPSEYNNASTPAADLYSLDGTKGGGICGIAIYQGKNDNAALTLVGDTASSVIGIIYAPDSQATLKGNGGFSAGTYSSGTLSGQLGTLAVLASSVTLDGNGALTLNKNANDSAGKTIGRTTQTTMTTPPVLTN